MVIVHGEETDESEINNLQVTAWALLPLLSSLLSNARVHYLRGGIAVAQSHHTLKSLLVTQSLHPPESGDPEPLLRSARGHGLFHLNTSPPTRTHFEIDQPMPSPLPIMPSSDRLNDANGSPPPSQLSFRRPAPPRRPSAPNLTRIVTVGGDEQQPSSLPRLHIRTAPTRSATLPITPTQPSASPNGNTVYLPPQSPSHLNLLHSHHTPPALPSPRWTASPAELLPPPSPRFARPTPPRTPDTPLAIPPPVPSPRTARPDDLQTTTESEFPTFTVSMILPNFLYLGPELTLPEHVQELKALGIKRILNIAAECDDDHGLNLRENFERYVRIPIRDTVEEDQITRGLKEACEMLGRASLHFLQTFHRHLNMHSMTLRFLFVFLTTSFFQRRGKSVRCGYLCALQSWQVALCDRRNGLPHSCEPLDAFACLCFRPRPTQGDLAKYWVRFRTDDL